MQAADTPQVEQAIQRAQANELFISSSSWADPPPLTVNDARRIIACLENPQFDTVVINSYSLHDDAVLNVLRDGLPLCTAVKTVSLSETNLGNEDLDRLRPVFYNTSVRELRLYYNNIEGQDGGEVLRDLLAGNDTLLELNLSYNSHFGPEVAIGFGKALAENNTRLQKLNICSCNIGNGGLANLLPADGINNNSLTHLELSGNYIEGEEGGRQVSLLLQRFPALKMLDLSGNRLGPLGAHALASGLAAAIHLEELSLWGCGLENDGVANLILPDGQAKRSLTNLNLGWNDIQGVVGGENVVSLASHCTTLDSINVNDNDISPDQRRRLDLLLERKRLCTEASAFAGSPFPVLFRFVEKAHCHKHGLSAIFLILQNDGDDYFCTALNRSIEPRTHASCTIL